MRPSARFGLCAAGLFCCALALTGCANAATESASEASEPSTGAPIHDLVALELPRFIGTNYIDLDAIDSISRFRSAEGHSYTDGAETCRSMKHYFRPKADVDAAAIPIVAPVSGTVAFTRPDRWGLQVGIRPADQLAFTVILFHLNPSTNLTEGTSLTEGQALGTHIGAQTWSDVAVGVDTPRGYRLVSWFDVITDDLFAKFRARGLASRAAAIISRAERDADPLTCNGDEAIQDSGRLSGWVTLR